MKNVATPTGWIEIEGTKIDGTTGVGWITAGQVDETISNGGGPPAADLSWCPPKGSSTPHPSGRLRLASWNLGALHAENGRSIYADSPKRADADYERIRCYIRMLDPDILAVQEVDRKAALERVVDLDVYNVHVESRGANSVGQQNTGFAYKKGLTAAPRPDFTDLNTNGQLRTGARIDATVSGKTLKLMSVHLKSGCFSNQDSGSACTTLEGQVPKLEAWIDDPANQPEGLALLGDFNRRFNMPGDSVWAEIDDGTPADADLVVATEYMPISCKENKYTEFIDHIVFDKQAAQWSERASFRQVTFRQADKANWDQISDHCPVVAEMWVQ